MTGREDKKPISGWLAVAPALIAATMVLRLLDDDASAPRWIYVLLLVIALALLGFVLFQRRRWASRNR